MSVGCHTAQRTPVKEDMPLALQGFASMAHSEYACATGLLHQLVCNVGDDELLSQRLLSSASSAAKSNLSR